MLKNAIKLYFSQYSPPARGVYLVIKALNLDVELKDVNILSRQYLTSDLRSINPQHTVPTLKDGNFVLWDSHAISGYLVGMYGKDDGLYPKDPQKRAVVDQRLYFDTENLFPKVMDAVYPLLFMGKTTVPGQLQSSINRSYRFLEKFLEKSIWLAGNNLTIADLCCVSSISTLDYLVPISSDKYPKLAKFLERSKELPYYHEANQFGLDMLGNKIQEKLIMTYVKSLSSALSQNM